MAYDGALHACTARSCDHLPATLGARIAAHAPRPPHPSASHCCSCPPQIEMPPDDDNGSGTRIVDVVSLMLFQGWHGGTHWMLPALLVLHRAQPGEEPVLPLCHASQAYTFDSGDQIGEGTYGKVRCNTYTTWRPRLLLAGVVGTCTCTRCGRGVACQNWLRPPCRHAQPSPPSVMPALDRARVEHRCTWVPTVKAKRWRSR